MKCSSVGLQILSRSCKPTQQLVVVPWCRRASRRQTSPPGSALPRRQPPLPPPTWRQRCEPLTDALRPLSLVLVMCIWISADAFQSVLRHRIGCCLTTAYNITRRYPRILAVYNKPEYDRMFLRDAATGRKIFVYPTFPGFDPAFTADMQSNGGRNDIVTVRSS